jgi:acyl-CoA thioesterase-1
MLPDGIHPNADAQPVLLDNAWPIINEALSGTDIVSSG